MLDAVYTIKKNEKKQNEMQMAVNQSILSKVFSKEIIGDTKLPPYEIRVVIRDFFKACRFTQFVNTVKVMTFYLEDIEDMSQGYMHATVMDSGRYIRRECYSENPEDGQFYHTSRKILNRLWDRFSLQGDVALNFFLRSCGILIDKTDGYSIIEELEKLRKEELNKILIEPRIISLHRYLTGPKSIYYSRCYAPIAPQRPF
jgi:hypothetical protein